MLYNDSANSFSQSAIPLTFNSQSKTNWDANWVKGAFLVSDCNTFHIENALKWHKLPKTYRLNDIKMTKKILSKENAWNGYLEQFPSRQKNKHCHCSNGIIQAILGCPTEIYHTFFYSLVNPSNILQVNQEKRVNGAILTEGHFTWLTCIHFPKLYTIIALLG